MLLKRKDFIDSVDSNKIWSKELNDSEILELLDNLKNILNNHDYETDNNFVLDGRRAGLKQDIENRLNNNDSDENTIIVDCLFNFWEIVNNEYTGSVFTVAQELGLSPAEVDTMCSNYRKKDIICKEEKEFILELINMIHNHIKNNI